MATKIIFITGTDTGVGKTLLTALLLAHLRSRGCRALALKPFCSGGRADAELLRHLQNGELTLDEVNPFYFPEPIAPLVSARKHKRFVSLDQVVQHINSIASRVSSLATTTTPNSLTRNSEFGIQNYLLIEGSGGLLVPLGEGYTVRDVIARLDCEIIVVSRNKLGTINHTLLTLRALLDSALCIPRLALKVVLMDTDRSDISSRSNAALLSELIAPTPLLRLPFLGARAGSPQMVRKNAGKVRKILARAA